MQTPGMLLFTGASSVTVGRATEYAKMAEERGFRNFLVTVAAIYRAYPDMRRGGVFTA